MTKERALLVIPAYNEGERLAPFLKDLCEHLDDSFDLLVVDDGSSSEDSIKMQNIVKCLQVARPKPTLLDILAYSPNRGKGAAIREGFKQRQGNHKLLGFVDADGGVGWEEVKRLKNLIEEDESLDALLASRRVGKTKKVERSLIRGTIGSIFSFLLSKISDLDIKDTQCGLKYFKTPAYTAIENKLKKNGFSIDIELCTYLIAMGYKVKEIGISSKDIKGSKVRILRDSLEMLYDCIEIGQRSKKHKRLLS
jgi:glycosyltransferase involved in cell wall biosynthesis